METVKCELCNEPMPAGEEMFKFHGYSGPCEKSAVYFYYRENKENEQTLQNISWIESFNALANRIESWANNLGWNSDDPNKTLIKDNPTTTDIEIYGSMKTHYDIAKLGLMMSEIAEAIEGRRKGDPKSDKIPEFTQQEEELADCVVRIMHYAAHEKLRVAEALVAKLAYNDTRPYKHNKLA